MHCHEVLLAAILLVNIAKIPSGLNSSVLTKTCGIFFDDFEIHRLLWTFNWTGSFWRNEYFGYLIYVSGALQFVS